MAKPSITNITTSQTFQNWLDKTNEMVNIFKSEVVTASSGGDTTTGDATLVGDFEATNITADTLLSTDAIASQTGGAEIDFQSPIDITGTTTAICATFTYGTSGGQTRYTDGTTAWDIGMEDSTDAHFIINTGIGDNKFELSPAGTLYVKNIIVDGDITANNVVGSLGGTTTDSIDEGSTNLYFTEERARTAVTKAHVDSLDVDAASVGGVELANLARTDQVGEIFSGYVRADGGFTTLKGLTTGETIVAKQDITTLLDVNCTNVNCTDIRATGSVITDYSTSDINLKTDLEVIDSPLEKIELINGYTYALKKRPDERLTGLVAQELEEVLPEAVFVFEDDDGTDRKGINYGNTVSLLVEAIKELKHKVEELERKTGDK